MPLRFAANLDRLWAAEPLAARFAHASDHGFEYVEYLFPTARDVPVIDRALADTGLELALIDIAVGDVAAGDRGLLAVPGRSTDFQSAALADLRLAERWGVSRVNALAGRVAASVSDEQAVQTAVENLRRLLAATPDSDVVLMIECINAHDVPGYALRHLDRAVEIVETLDHPRVRLQFDQYHVERAGLDPAGAYRRHAALVAHVQIAAAPGRHEPTPANLALHAFLDELDARRYRGLVGLEYDPTTTTDAALAWLGDRGAGRRAGPR